MGRLMSRLVACASVALCLSVAAPAAWADGGKTIAAAPPVGVGVSTSGSLYDAAFYSGYSVAFWTASFNKGDRIDIKTSSAHGDTPPCQILYMPGTDDVNVGATTPILDPQSSTRNGTHDGQRWVATQTGTYVLAMTNADIFLSGPHQCLDAPSGRPFTFKVMVAHRGSGGGSSQGAGGGVSAGAGESTRVVRPGQSLWLIAQALVRDPGSIAQVAFEVGHLWDLNAARIGTGDPDLIYAGQELRLK
jgi:hypothetical protein